MSRAANSPVIVYRASLSILNPFTALLFLFLSLKLIVITECCEDDSSKAVRLMPNSCDPTLRERRLLGRNVIHEVIAVSFNVGIAQLSYCRCIENSEGTSLSVY